MKRLIKSFYNAFRGLGFVLRYEKNFQIHLVIGFLTLIGAYLLKFSHYDFILILMIIVFVLVAELLNTIIELLIDYINPNFNQRARLIKDVAAGTVLLMAISAVIIGFFIFYPYLIRFFLKN